MESRSSSETPVLLVKMEKKPTGTYRPKRTREMHPLEATNQDVQAMPFRAAHYQQKM